MEYLRRIGDSAFRVYGWRRRLPAFAVDRRRDMKSCGRIKRKTPKTCHFKGYSGGIKGARTINLHDVNGYMSKSQK
jgi:hypothetical protein